MERLAEALLPTNSAKLLSKEAMISDERETIQALDGLSENMIQ